MYLSTLLISNYSSTRSGSVGLPALDGFIILGTLLRHGSAHPITVIISTSRPLLLLYLSLSSPSISPPMSIWLYVGIHLILLRSSYVLMFLRHFLLLLAPLSRFLGPHYTHLLQQPQKQK